MPNRLTPLSSSTTAEALLQRSIQCKVTRDGILVHNISYLNTYPPHMLASLCFTCSAAHGSSLLFSARNFLSDCHPLHRTWWSMCTCDVPSFHAPCQHTAQNLLCAHAHPVTHCIPCVLCISIFLSLHFRSKEYYKCKQLSSPSNRLPPSTWQLDTVRCVLTIIHHMLILADNNSSFSP